MKSRLIQIGLSVFAATILLPLFWTLMSSLKTGSEIQGSPWSLPGSLQWNNYALAWQDAGIGQSMLNSAVVTVATLVILLPVGAMAAYIFAKYPFPGSRILFGTFLGGMMFPHFLVVVPLFFLLKALGLLDSLIGLTIVYVAYSLAFTIFVLTGFFHSLPNELAEAATIDGCGHSGTFWRIMLPLAKPGMIVVGIFNGIGLWNEYGLALSLLSKTRTLPLSVADMTQTQHYQANYGALFAGLVIVMTPVLIVYWIFRDKIHETMLAGAVKG